MKSRGNNHTVESTSDESRQADLGDPASREAFAAQGFVKLASYFTADEVAAISQLTAELTQRPTVEFDTDGQPHYRSTDGAGDGIRPIRVNEKSDPELPCRIEDLLSASSELAEFIRTRVTPAISQLAGSEFVCFKDKLNFKHPGGGAFTPHQDYPAYAQFPPGFHITAMITLDPATPENGCLLFADDYLATVQAAAKTGDLEADESELRSGHFVLPSEANGDIKPEIVDLFSWQYAPTQPGDLVLFNSFVPHQSFLNTSERSRRAMFLTHNAMSEGDHRLAYYDLKRSDPNNPLFHWAVPSTVRRADS